MSAENERLYGETQRRLREITTLYEASRACLSISDQKGLLTTIIEAAARAIGATSGSVILIDEGKGEYVFGAHYGLSQETVATIEAELHIPLGKGLIEAMVTTGQPMTIDDVTTDPRWIPMEMKEPIRSFLGVPLLGRGRQPLGAINLNHSDVSTFDEDHARLLSTFANQAAMAIENAQLYEQAQARSRYLETLQRINATLRSTLPLSEVLTTIAQGTGEALHYVGSLITVPDATGERLILGAVWGSRFLDAAVKLTGLEVGSFSLPLTAEENPMAQAYLSGELHAWSEEPERIVVGVKPAISPKLAPVIAKAMGARLAACVPLPFGEKVVGVLVVFSPREQLSDEERSVLLGLADQAGLAIENAQLYEQAQQEIAKRKRVIEALRESEERYRCLVELSFDAIIIHREGKIVYINTAGAELLGASSSEEIVGKSILDFVHPDYLEIVQARVLAVTEGRVAPLTEEKLIRLDGTSVDAEVVGIPITYQGQPAVQVVIRDITERKQAEEALAEERNLLRTLIDNLPDLIYIKDTESRFVIANNATAQFMGVSPDELMGRTDFDFYPQELAMQFHADEQAIIKSGQPLISKDEPNVDQAGNQRWLLTTKVPLRDSEGEIVGIVGIGRDITERKQVEEALRRSEEDYRLLFEQSVDGIIIITESRIVRVNQAFCALHGLPVERVVGMSPLDLLHPEDRNIAAQRIKAIQSGEPVSESYVYRGLREDGSVFWVEVRSKWIEWEGGQAIQSIVRDVTERKRAEEALRESEERYRQAQENTPNPVLFADREGIIQTWNRACEQIFQYKAEEIIGQAYHKLLWDPKDRPAVEAMLAQVWQGHSLSGKDMTYRCKDGTQRFMVSRLYPLRDHEGHVQGCVLTNTDITERKKLEEQLRQAQKMEAIGTLAGGIAHDFNNILTGILGFASVVHTELPTDSPLRSDVETIIRSAQRGSELTRQLLTFARRGMVAVHPLNLNEIAREVIKLLERTIDKAIAIEPYLAKDLVTVEGNIGQLHQMLLNLCLNARDAMPQGGQLIIETQNVTLSGKEIHTKLDLEAGQYVLLSVTDTGIGMDAETQQHLFEPFFTTKEKGRGLGLAMVYGIVRGHGGAIHVYSEPGQGSTFKVYLPVADRPAEDVAPEEAEVVGGSETVLVVDDEEPVRTLLQRILKEGGYTVLLATNGVEAVDLYTRLSRGIDLVVLDIIMPQMGGRETYERLRGISTGVKVLLSSGYSENGQAQDILAAGAQGFLQKPYDLRAVLRKVREVLDSIDNISPSPTRQRM